MSREMFDSTHVFISFYIALVIRHLFPVKWTIAYPCISEVFSPLLSLYPNMLSQGLAKLLNRLIIVHGRVGSGGSRV